MKMKRKPNSTTSAHRILDNDEYLNNSTTYSPILTSSNDIDPTMPTLNDNSSLISSNNNTLTSSTNINDATSSSSSINNNDSTSSININNTTTTSNNNIPILTSTSNYYPGGRKSTSNVWKYAKKSDDGTIATCQSCDFTCVISAHSTSSIRYHLIHKHNKQDLIINSSPSKKPRISESFKRELHSLCYNSIVVDHRPFNDLRKKGIMAIFNKLCPGYVPPHRNQVSKQLKHLYMHHFQLLKDELKEIDYIGLTLDFWSNRRNQSFLCITGHWYTEKMSFESKIIHFSSFNERHTAKNIADAIKECLINLDIYSKIVSITCDGGANLVAACKLLDPRIKRIWCCAHRLHLVIINSLGIWNVEEINNTDTQISSSTAPTTAPTISFADIISKNQDESMDISCFSDDEPDKSLINEANDGASQNGVLTFDDDDKSENENENNLSDNDEAGDETANNDLIRDNWSIDIETNVAATEEVNLTMNVLKKCRKIASVTKKSSIISNFIRVHQASFKVKRTINIDCKSRWNSTYNLIDSLIDAKLLLLKLFNEKRSLQLRKDQLEKLTNIELNSEDWDFISSLSYVLKPFSYATTMMSGKYYPSIGLAFHAIKKLKQFCLNDNTDNEHVNELKKLLSAKLYQYFYSDTEQYEHFQYHGFFDPAAHLTLNDVEKQRCERYVKNLILNDIYCQKQLPNNNTKGLSTPVAASASSSTSAQLSNLASQNNSTKLTTYDEFIAACGDQSSLLETSKEKSKRICLNDELRYFRAAVQDFNLKTKPSTTSALDFWQTHYIQLPLLSNLAKVHLVACGSSVPSESAFSCSAYVARKERSRLSPENLGYSVFLKDKLAKQ